MKRLLATSALVAAGLWGASEAANAQAKVAPISVTVGGFHEQTFGYVGNKNNVLYSGAGLSSGSTSAPIITSRPNRFSQSSDSEIWFSGNSTLANGMTVGFRVRMEANTASDQIDESYLFVDGGFGRFVVGSRNDAAYWMHVFGPTAGLAVSSPSRPTSPGNAGWSLNESTAFNYIARPANATLLDTTAPKLNGASNGGAHTFASGNDLQRLTYFTPRFAGFQAGVSYTPNTYEDAAAGFGVADKKSTANRTNAFSGALNYSNNFSGISIDASAGMSYYPKVSGAATNTAASDSIKDYALGAQVGMSGFAVGGSYRKVSVNDFDPSNGYAYYVGASWTGGPASIGLGYLASKVEGAAPSGTNNTGKDKFTGVMLSGIYAIGPGVSIIGSATYFNIDNRDDTITGTTSQSQNDNKGVAVVGGLRLTF